MLYYPGCTLKTKAQNLDTYARKAAAALGFPLTEIDNWQCCGAVYPTATDAVAPKLAAVRALQFAHQKGQPLVTLCSACHHVLKRVNHDARTNPGFRRALRTYDETLDYAGEAEVLHYMEVLQREVGFAELKKRVTAPLTGQKIGAYYGCMLLRPADVMQFDDPENPQIFEDFLRALGAEPVAFPLRNECCGGYLALKTPARAAEMAAAVSQNAAKNEASLLVTACPLCLYNVATEQSPVPVVYFTELLAQALGLKEDAPCTNG